MRIMPRHVVHEQREQAIAKVIAIVAAASGEAENVRAKTKRYRNTAADARVLRMIPVCAEGIGGTIPDTQPLQTYIANEARRERHLRSIRCNR